VLTDDYWRLNERFLNVLTVSSVGVAVVAAVAFVVSGRSTGGRTRDQLPG